MTTMLERRRIEAELARLFFATLSDELGEERARELLAKTIEKAAETQAKALVASGQKVHSPADIAELVTVFAQGGALEVEFVDKSERSLGFNVTRCKFAEMYTELGLKDLGKTLSCNRDGTFFCSLNGDIAFKRTQTIMEGAEHCDFRFAFPARKA